MSITADRYATLTRSTTEIDGEIVPVAICKTARDGELICVAGDLGIYDEEEGAVFGNNGDVIAAIRR